ncbi:carbon-nitrogen hydrolase family protein [Flavobacterium sp. PS2]|uniref:carbon-nitrogen hydrolase family protein n=1 Tax=Flavobacterium sp. PS2 TaxID=3384157 RepID=UPI00390C9772
MKICVAQTKPVKGDISLNIKNHKTLIDFAISHKANAIFFPELSITSYEPELVQNLGTNLDDERFDAFQEISNANNITIGIGVPTKSNEGILISMIIFQPNKSRQIYSKQQLHSDELPYFVCGNNQLILTIDGIRIAPAICYESLQSSHSEEVNRLGADIYIASVAKSQNGVNKAAVHYPEVAKKYNMTVLMSNSVGPCDDFECVGNSAVWDTKGELLAQLNETQEGILVFDTETQEVIEHVV